MAKSERVHFELEANAAKAVEAFLKTGMSVNDVRKAVEKFNKSAKETKKEVAGISNSAQTGGAQIAKWIGGFATIATVIKGLRAVSTEMDAIAAKRNEFGQVALTAQAAIQKIAHLRGDVSQAGLDRAIADVKNITMVTGTGYQAAASTLFFSESQLGSNTPAAMSSAMNIAKFAAPAGLTAEEVKLLPKLFGAIGATDSDSQNKALNQLYKATGGSIAETGEYLQPFIKTLVTDVVRGFTYEQSLSRMTAAVGATGSVEEAATMSTIAVDIAAGRTQQALDFFKGKYLLEQAQEVGISPQSYIKQFDDKGKRINFKKGASIEDMLGEEGVAELAEAVKNKGGSTYSELSDPERYSWFTDFYQQMQDPTKLDELKTKLGSKGFNAIRAVMSLVSQEKFKEMFPVITGAGDQDLIEPMAEQYSKTVAAAAEYMQIRNVSSGAVVGQESLAFNELMEMTKQITEQARARAGTGGDLAKGIWSSSAFGKKATGHQIFQQIMSENLAVAYEQDGDKEQILSLIKEINKTTSFTLNSQLLRDVYQATSGFGLMEESGQIASPDTIAEINKQLNAGSPTSRYVHSPYGSQKVDIEPTDYFGGRNSSYFFESMQSYFQTNQDAAEKMLKASENNLKAAQMNQKAAEVRQQQDKNTVNMMRGND